MEQRSAGLATRSIKKASKLAAIDLAISMVDLTTLEGSDTPGKVRTLAAKARRPDPDNPDTPHVAALCIYPDMVAVAVAALAGSGVGIASVATAFPTGRTSLEVRLADTEVAVDAGATEIDMVIDRGAFLAGRYGKVFDDIVAVKQACGGARLKVILETGELATYDNVRRASWLALLAGGDFIKTSTGKISPAATLPVTHVMLQAVRDWYEQTGERRAVKPAGGIRTTKDAIRYLVAVKEVAGPEWLDPFLFPVRRVQPAERPADATAHPTRGPLLRPRLRDRGLSGDSEGRCHGTHLDWDYAPAPESAAIGRLQDRYQMFVGGRFVDGRGDDVKTHQPGHRGGARLGLHRQRGRRRRRGAPPPAPRTSRCGHGSRRAERGKYLYRIARGIAERARELAVVETLDNGKPIKESRDVDVPTAAAHFFYHAGWADKLQHAGFRAGAGAARGGRPGDPVELPAADGRLEDRARRWPPGTPS